jgi:putative transferase (TIGR04331 family)
MLFDRWTSIAQALQQHDISETVVFIDRDGAMVPNDMSEFLGLFVGDSWNHYLYAAILQQFTAVRCTSLEPLLHEGACSGSLVSPLRRSARERLKDWCARAAGSLARDTDAFLIGTSLPPLDEIRMYRRLGQVPQRWRSVPCVRADWDESQRQWLVAGDNRNEFEACVRTLIPQQIPKLYLEAYPELMGQVGGLPWPQRPKLIWSSNSYNSDDVFKAWAAQKAEAGATLVAGQHGGHYGIGRWSFNEEHDIAISDSYLSWGWMPPDLGKVRPVGQLKSKQPLNVRHAAQPGALLVGCTMPQLSYVMYSAIVAPQWLEYFEDQCTFVAQLPQAIRDALTVRLYPEDYQWNQEGRWRERFSGLRLESGQSSIDSLIRQSRLYIATYNATTYLESFAMDVPTVIYWNPFHWELRDAALPLFEDLKRVGVFHETPESAALHVAKIWADVDAWWNGPELREVLERFKAQYCSSPPDLLGQVHAALCEAHTARDAGKTSLAR